MKIAHVALATLLFAASPVLARPVAGIEVAETLSAEGKTLNGIVSHEDWLPTFAAIAGDQFELGPMGQGPGRIAKVTAKVTIGEPKATRQLGDTITFDIRIPLEIDLLVDLRLDKQRFNVDGEVALRATARAAEPLALVLEVAKPRPTNISVHVSTKSIRGEIVRIIGGVDAEISELARQFLEDAGRRAGFPSAPQLSADAVALLEAHALDDSGDPRGDVDLLGGLDCLLRCFRGKALRHGQPVLGKQLFALVFVQIHGVLPS